MNNLHIFFLLTLYERVRKASKTMGTAFGRFIWVIKIPINTVKNHIFQFRGFVFFKFCLQPLYPHDQQQKAFNYWGLEMQSFIDYFHCFSFFLAAVNQCGQDILNYFQGKTLIMINFPGKSNSSCKNTYCCTVFKKPNKKRIIDHNFIVWHFWYQW